jgi:hypothetical protein
MIDWSGHGDFPWVSNPRFPVTNTAKVPRIVSLIASATEIVHALGMGDFMVARSHECDCPSSVLSLPVFTSPKFAISGNSREILPAGELDSVLAG